MRGPSPRAARWKGLLVVAVDGTIMAVAGSPASLAATQPGKSSPFTMSAGKPRPPTSSSSPPSPAAGSCAPAPRTAGDQEACALLVTCQAIRTAIADAAAAPGADPDRASFTIALNTARDQVIPAAGVTAGPVADLAGDIGRAVLASLMPGRRPRVSPRVVKRALSKYRALGKVDRATCKATIDIAILAPPLTDDNKT